jgi:predicted transcriptional regulator
MKQKALKNIPKPDQNKLAMFYGQNKQEEEKKAPEMSTVDNMATVDRMTTVANEEGLKKALKPITTNSQQQVYLELYKKALESGQDTTGWIGYRTLVKDLEISLKTAQRAIERLIELKLITRVKISNNAKQKGSKYRIHQPQEKATVDKMTTVDIM